ncbi:unnamed protein product [Candidula unifasciata]|uniref:PDZ domain-containing protein n=1 Tax=Candidula unifasciata TaxID=100452 RepID=A0A8S3ZKE6_9EUPU|nr:unnamed protein product [Candidula unifasciata]
MVSSDRLQITLTGGAPWGFRLSGGGGMPLIINKIRKKSQAHVQGLKEGDAVISINGVHVHDKTQDEALELVEAAGDTLVLEIFRGDKSDRDQGKPQKLIQVQTSHRAPTGTIRLLTTSDDGVSPGEVVLIPSGDSVTSESLGTADVRPGLTVSRVVAFSSPGRVLAVSSSNVTSTSKTTVVGRSPVISSDARPRDTHSATSAPNVSAKPFYVTQAGSESPPYFHPSQPQPVRQPPPGGPRPQTSIAVSQSYSTSHPPRFSSQPPRAPPPPPVSPKPQRFLSPQPPSFGASPQPPSFGATPSGVTPTAASSTFDRGQTHRELTREQHVQRSADGSSTTVVQREVTTTSGRPSFVKGQTSAFNAVQPHEVIKPAQKSIKTTTTTVKSTSIITQKGPTPFASSIPSNILQQQYQAPTAPSYSTDTQHNRTETQLFKPTKFVPSSIKKDVTGLFSAPSPLADHNVQDRFREGKENVSPQPMFQVKNIVSDKAKSTAPEVWRPNMWLPGQQPPSPRDQPQTAPPREDLPPSKPGYSFIEEQKRKLLASQAPKHEYQDVYGQESQEVHEDPHKHRLHIFAPPVEIHPDEGSPHPAYDDHYYMDDYEDGASSPDSIGSRRKKNLYSDSAFYNTPGKAYPTITEQMKLCKKIAQSLTSAANKRARGAKMFMKRKRKSSKWIHEGHSELSSSAGDVANLHELDSELNPDEGGNFYFKIPSIKQRVGNEAKSTKMSLTQEQFEQLRLSSKKCDHKSLPPDPCFDIVADLKAHKGKGGRMFERRRQRSDKFVYDETNAKFPLPHGKPDDASQGEDHHLNPREVALKHGWKGDPGAVQNAQTPAVPLVHYSLKSDDSPMMIKGTNFNRIAKGWSGGIEYPVAEQLHHISPVRQLAPQPNTPSTQPQQRRLQQQQTQQQQQQQQQQDNYNKVKAWQSNTESFSAADRFQDWQRHQPENRWQDSQQQRRQEDSRTAAWQEQRPSQQQTARPKSWHQESYDTQQAREEHDYHYPTVDYRFGAGHYPSVAYKQPIIPGTDL